LKSHSHKDRCERRSIQNQQKFYLISEDFGETDGIRVSLSTIEKCIKGMKNQPE
jgi:hypothetical protein